jgi:hypothetical protein
MDPAIPAFSLLWASQPSSFSVSLPGELGHPHSRRAPPTAGIAAKELVDPIRYLDGGRGFRSLARLIRRGAVLLTRRQKMLQPQIPNQAVQPTAGRAR